MDGILVVDKPKGPTSHDIVAFLRRTFGLKKVGHGGTLDPMATGVLVLLVGCATKSSGAFLSDDKEYEAKMILGAVSDTHDACGTVRKTSGALPSGHAQIEEAFKSFIGEQEQLPPMYSAVRLKGKKLYELARRGIDVERPTRRILIKEMEIISVAMPEVSFRVVCSKGTYIRQLVSDIGSALGCGAYLSALRRTRSGRLGITGALTIDELRQMRPEELAKRLILP